MPRAIFRSFILLGTASLLIAASEPESVPLPAMSAIEPGTVSSLSLALDQAIISITVDDDSAPSWKAMPVRQGQGTSELSISQQDRALSIRRSESEAPLLPIRLEIVVPSDFNLDITGEGLELDIQAPITEPPDPVQATLEPTAIESTILEPTGEKAPSKASESGSTDGEEKVETSGPDLQSELDDTVWLHEVRLVDSSATVSGLVGLRLRTQRSEVQLRGTSGPLELQTEEGSIDSEDHYGLIHLTNRSSKVRIERQLGGLLFETTGGEVTALTGGGPYRGEASGGKVALLHWEGQAVLAGQETQIEVRDGREGAQLEIAGNGLDIDIVRLEGSLEAELEGGRLRGSQLTGNTTLRARLSTQLTLEGLVAEKVQIDLTEEAGADLRDIDGALEVVLDHARLQVTGVRQLGIKGVDCEMIAEEVAAVRMISLKNSTFDLDLTALERQPAIALRGAVDGRVELAQPCVVRMAGDVGLIEENATVTGCQLVTLASPKEERMRGQKGYPEGTIVLVTTLEKGGRIEIDGVVVP